MALAPLFSFVAATEFLGIELKDECIALTTSILSRRPGTLSGGRKFLFAFLIDLQVCWTFGVV